MTLDLEVVHDGSAFGDPAGWAEWNTLVSDSPGGSFFQTAQWCAAWQAELSVGAPITVARVRDADTLVGGAALARVRQPLWRGERPATEIVTNAGTGTGAADHCGFPVRAGAGSPVVDMLWEWALHHAGDRPLLFANLDPDTPIAQRAAREMSVIGEEQCPIAIVAPGSDFASVRAGWTKNRRKTITKKLDAFNDAGGRFEWIDDPGAVVETLPAVFQLHDTRRAELGRASRFGHDDANRAFHCRLARYRDDWSGCWVQLATVGSDVVGALYGFRLAGSYSVFQSGWDPTWSSVSLGLIQYAEAFRHVVDHGGTRFDMCRGTDPYKLRFATETRTEQSYARARGASGLLLNARWAALRARRRWRAHKVEAAATEPTLRSGTEPTLRSGTEPA